MQPAPLCSSPHHSYAPPPLARRHSPSKPTASPSQSLPPTHSLPINGFIAAQNPSAAPSLKGQSFLSLLRHYTRAGRMRDARELFDEMPERTPFAWTILMSGYALHGPADEALSLFRGLFSAGLRPDSFDISIILRICASLCLPNQGKELHCFGLKSGYLEDLFVANGLVTMYASCGLLRFSRVVFWGIRKPDLVSWTCMLTGLVKNGHEDEVLLLLEQMAWAGILFDAYVLSIGLRASANLNCVGSGKQIHCCLVKSGLDSHCFLGNSLLEFYGRVGELGLMRMLFDRMIERDLVAWNTMISCYACSLFDAEALMLFHEMIKSGFVCDDFTLCSVLQAVTSQGALSHGKEIHGFAIRAGFEFNCHMNSALLDMYIKCSNCELGNACNDLIPIKLFIFFQSIGAEFDDFIIASILKFCASQNDLETGKVIHSCILKLGMNSDPVVMSSLIDVYAKCGLIRTSLLVFARIVEPSAVSWSAIIAGFCFNGHFHKALELFRAMQFHCIKANEFTYTSVVLACLADGKIHSGREIHCSIIRHGYGYHVSVISTLINFYTGLMKPCKAVLLSSLIPEDDVSWVSLIKSFAMAADGKMILWLFHMIQKSRGKLDHLSASYVLDSCANPVFLSAGTQAHAYAIKRGLLSETNTNNSLINMYSRCGTISDAGNAFEQIPEKNAASWTSIISANVNHGCPSKALRQFQQMIGKDKYPNCDTFLSVLKACRQMGLVDEAFRLFIYMVEVYKIKPSMEIYSCMVQVLSCAGMNREAEHFIETAVPSNSNPLAWRTGVPTSSRIAKVLMEKL
ncbi:hypothetical protein M5K25_008111 [Dendrobium thyrsiflorum]|uniref:Pentatricopeptide repeat-containing protein n=1 Tax=Dendrobium thyrsiflorum TaxID=117978 RepID=A0ABD0V776_DENTH